ncbi:hypothetical protein BH10CHL1_BH10CHL1_41230 [soil metagenome]
MAKIIFVTCQKWPLLSASDNYVAQALMQLGHQIEAKPWNGEFAWFAHADLVVLRSNWDYHAEIAQFRAGLERLETAQIPLQNSASLVCWNLHKGYLLELQAKGVKLPTSILLPPETSLAEIYQQQNWSEAVVKPVYGASGHLVERVRAGQIAAWTQGSRQQRPADEWLVQAYMPEIAQSGEISLIFVEGRYSHAVQKRPQSGEFRINSQYQGQITRIEPNGMTLEQARQPLVWLDEIPLYARVDGIVTADGTFYLMELELNEPGLYFQYAPEKALGLAEAIHARVAGQ